MQNNEPDLAKECLADVIRTYENDIRSGLADDPDIKEIRLIFADLVVYMTRMYLNVRYCHNDRCPCSPLSHLANHVKRHNELFKQHLHHNAYILLDDISNEFLGTPDSGDKPAR